MPRGRSRNVSPAEREIARRADLLAGGVLAVSVPLAVQAMSQVIARCVRAFLRGENPVETLRRLMPEAMGAALAEAMALARLKGLAHNAQQVPSRALSLASGDSRTKHAAAVEAMRRRMQVPASVLQQFAEEAKRPAATVLHKATALAEAKLQQVMTEIVERGVTPTKGVAMLTEAFKASGVAPGNSYTIENVYRTQIQIAFAAGEADVDSEPEVQEVLWGYKYVTVGDSRVRATHAAMDGTTLPKDDPWWRENMPPNGFSCRCKAIRLYEEQHVVRPPRLIPGDEAPVRVKADRGFEFNPADLFVSPKIDLTQAYPVLRPPEKPAATWAGPPPVQPIKQDLPTKPQRETAPKQGLPPAQKGTWVRMPDGLVYKVMGAKFIPGKDGKPGKWDVRLRRPDGKETYRKVQDGVILPTVPAPALSPAVQPTVTPEKPAKATSAAPASAPEPSKAALPPLPEWLKVGAWVRAGTAGLPFKVTSIVAGEKTYIVRGIRHNGPPAEHGYSPGYLFPVTGKAAVKLEGELAGMKTAGDPPVHVGDWVEGATGPSKVFEVKEAYGKWAVSAKAPSGFVDTWLLKPGSTLRKAKPPATAPKGPKPIFAEDTDGELPAWLYVGRWVAIGTGTPWRVTSVSKVNSSWIISGRTAKGSPMNVGWANRTGAPFPLQPAEAPDAAPPAVIDDKYIHKMAPESIGPGAIISVENKGIGTVKKVEPGLDPGQHYVTVHLEDGTIATFVAKKDATISVLVTQEQAAASAAKGLVPPRVQPPKHVAAPAHVPQEMQSGGPVYQTNKFVVQVRKLPSGGRDVVVSAAGVKDRVQGEVQREDARMRAFWKSDKPEAATASERYAIRKWAGTAYRAIRWVSSNGQCGVKPASEGAILEARQYAAKLGSAYKRARSQGLMSQHTLFRGTGRVTDELFEALTSPGSVIRESAWTSYTSHVSVAQKFGRLTMEVRENTEGMWIRNGGGLAHENESIVPPGYRWEVIGVFDGETGEELTSQKQIKGRNRIHVVGKMLPPDFKLAGPRRRWPLADDGPRPRYTDDMGHVGDATGMVVDRMGQALPDEAPPSSFDQLDPKTGLPLLPGQS